MIIIFIAVTFFACFLGTICGMGGGIIIKPVLDATGVMSGTTINFLSGCTVIAMTLWNLIKTLLKRESVIDMRNTTMLAIGAAAGGIIGKQLYNMVAGCFVDPDMASGIQAALLFLATLATMIYTLNKDRITSKQIDSAPVSLLIGFLLGVLGAFLGIGGGPFNIAVLYYFFSMETKKAAQNSLFIILISQIASTAKSVISGGIPAFAPIILISMVIVGVFGNETGRKLNRRLSDAQAAKCLIGAMLLIMAINVYNVVKFLF